MPDKIELLPNQETELKDVFPSREAEEAFFSSFLDHVRPELEKLRDAHQASEEQARNCWIR